MEDRHIIELDAETAALVNNLPKEVTPMRKAPREAHTQPTKPKKYSLTAGMHQRVTHKYMDKSRMHELSGTTPTQAELDKLAAAEIKRVARQLKRIARCE